MPPNKNRKYRSELQILYAILNACRYPIGKTHLTYKANLNSTQLNKYLDILIKGSYVIVLNNKKITITPKGRVLLTKLKDVLSLLYELNDDVPDRIKRVMSRIKIMFKVKENYMVKGESGILHVFDYFINDNIKLAIKIGKGDPLELLSFMVSLIDTGLRGIYLNTEYGSEMFSIYNYLDAFNKNVIIVDDPQELLEFLFKEG